MRSTAATAGPSQSWGEAVCHPKIAPWGGDQMGRSVVNDPALSRASAYGWRGSSDKHSFLLQYIPHFIEHELTKMRRSVHVHA